MKTFEVLNFGFLHIDHVYRVPHFVAPGETLSCQHYDRFAGGKGLNQSVALSRARVKVAHAGKIGPDSEFLKQVLTGAGSFDSAGARNFSSNGNKIMIFC